MTYNLCKNIINKDTYGTKEEMIFKLDVFLLNNRINQAEYNELIRILEEK